MNKLLILITLFASLNVFAWNDDYSFDNFTRVDDFNFSQEVDKKEWSILVFNNGYCPLNDSMMDCFPFEMKLNYLAPNIYGRNNNLQILNIDMQSSYIHQRYGISSAPTVIFLLDGAEMMRVENIRNPNALLQQTLNNLYKIPASL